MTVLAPILCFAQFIFFSPSIASAESPSFRVKVTSFKPKVGTIHCRLFASAVGFPSDPSKIIKTAKVKAGSSTVAVCEFENVKTGTYAITAYQDLNENELLDTHWYGLPSEPFGFSNNAPNATFGPPSFEACKIEHSSGGNDTVIQLRD